jgi:hypothetical protein
MPKPLKPGSVGVSLGYSDAPPESPADARRWIQEAVRSSRYTATSHVGQRLGQRQLGMDDLLHAIEHPRKVEPYPNMPRHGGTCWRLYGPDLDQEQEIGVGIEAYLDDRGRWAVLCTLFVVKERP